MFVLSPLTFPIACLFFFIFDSAAQGGEPPFFLNFAALCAFHAPTEERDSATEARAWAARAHGGSGPAARRARELAGRRHCQRAARPTNLIHLLPQFISSFCFSVAIAGGFGDVSENPKFAIRAARREMSGPGG